MLRLLSLNRKTGVSLNLPLSNCSPSPRCEKKCYGKKGPIMLKASRDKSLRVSNYLKGDDISELIDECSKFTSVRLCGNGDLLNEHVPNIIKLADMLPGVAFYGFTRKVDIANALSNRLSNLRVILSFDITTIDKESMNQFEGDLAFGPRLAEDVVPDDDRIVVVFPYHFRGNVINGIPHHPKDCGAVWHRTKCAQCRRCYPVKFSNR